MPSDCLEKPDFSYFLTANIKIDRIWIEYDHFLPFNNHKSTLLRFWFIFIYKVSNVGIVEKKNPLITPCFQFLQQYSNPYVMISIIQSNCQICSSLDHCSQNTIDFCTPTFNWTCSLSHDKIVDLPGVSTCHATSFEYLRHIHLSSRQKVRLTHYDVKIMFSIIFNIVRPDTFRIHSP